jgi:hypothetical protein
MSRIDDADECWESELQRRFDGAVTSIPLWFPPDPLALHHRLRRRRIRTRLAGLAGLIIMLSLVVTAGVAGSSDPTSATMTLFARNDAGMSQGELSAEAKIIRDRLDAIGDESARVSMNDGALVVTGAVILDQVAAKDTPGQLVVDLDGEIVSLLIRDPAQNGYELFDGRLDLAGPSRTRPEEIVATLQTGPWPIQLQLGRAA